MINYLQVEELTKSFGERVLFENISFGLMQGDRVGLIAKNGAGKTTLLNIIAGKDSGEGGKITFARDLRVGYLCQEPLYEQSLTVLEACFCSDNDVVRLISEYEKALVSEDMGALNSLMERMDHLNAWDYEQRAKQILSQLKITNLSQKISELSGGQLKRVALANVLITEPDILFLDEPTNHLDLEMTEWLEEYLSRSATTLLMVTHDRYFLDRVCNSIIEIDAQKVYSYKGNYSYYLEKRQERIDAKNSEIDSARNLMRTELDWMRRQPQARATKAKYRIDAFYELEKRAKQTRTEKNVKLDVKSSYIGTKIFEAKKLSKRFDDLVILKDFDYTFARYDKMGIVGNNGTGKSTFIKMLMGQVAPDSGEIDLGETVRFGYYSQEGLKFDDNMKVIDAVKDIAEDIAIGDGRSLTASQFLQHFLFYPEQQHNLISKLSGGEKRRLYLCTVLIKNPNFLVLDEPTNDLDIITLNILEEYLKNFKGCVIVVSHDRYFMDKVVDHLMIFRGGGELKDYPGNYTDYRDWQAEDDARKKAELAQKNKLESKQEKVAAVVAPKTKTRLSFNEKREFEMIEAQLPELEARKQELEELLNSGTLSVDELVATSQEVSTVIEEIDEKSMRWLELSELV
ncbi:MAG: ABC-F family ATP-binding cassette domain-containing protein [Rikenellaceae bacterium]